MRPYLIIMLLALSVGVGGCSRAVGTLPSDGVNSGAGPSNEFKRGDKAGSGFTTLYSFAERADGTTPNDDLTVTGQTLYGTTRSGGSQKGKGTVFEFANGAEQRLHTFNGSPDGDHPWAGLVSLNGTYYGTTEYGGSANHGAVFSIDQSGNENALYSFRGGADGVRPVADLVVVNGALYGTTATGGSADKGTIFEVTTGGTETVLHAFTGGADGANPTAPLVELNGVLYGTTRNGGSNDKGTVFSINPDGSAESVLYSFQGAPDGHMPTGGLTVLNGALYGTTYHGGKLRGGAIFEVTTSGSEQIIHSFAHTDGLPFAGLTADNNELYGTTLHGGQNEAGTVFKINPTSGKVTVLYTFTGAADGYGPAGRLTLFSGNLVGTTRYGGTANLGTIYSIAP